ncbi:DUF3850 domain-containing protein [Lactococcus allomyrinae]|uniref:DUF3850 domain-containing protein n=1 Tax=Lactococcus allomyrinae TaxID=2419773 RepID=A0A387BJU9_9LACT|nr:DUF3850 domain-containing protein [Lactococcus allomyrinae]AYG01317.1 DUF3850 domain-containing protein [Lactococcus allomyrinae]
MTKVLKKKLDPQFFPSVESGEKDFEVRLNDCDYQVGDILELKAFKEHHYYCRATINNKIAWVTCHEDWADIIRVRVVSVLSGEAFNYYEEYYDTIDGITTSAVMEVLHDYFHIEFLPKNYVVLGIKLLEQGKEIK